MNRSRLFFWAIVLTTVAIVSCEQKSNRERFLELGDVNYSIVYHRIMKYPIAIDEKVSSLKNSNFSDSLRNKKIVYAEIKQEYSSESNKKVTKDTSGYYVAIKNDSLSLLWEISFNRSLKITRLTEITYEDKEFFEKEGEKMNTKRKMDSESKN